MTIIFWNKIALIKEDTHRTKWIPQTGRLDHDQALLNLVLPHIPLHGTVIDIGANIGDHTIAYLKKVGSEGHVVAFEPHPEVYECLKINVPEAESYPYAISDKEETLNLVLRPNTGESYCTTTNLNESVPIKAVTLDSFKFSSVDLIKIDVEGYELQTLKGARQTLIKCKPRMVIEINDNVFKRTGGNRQDIYTFLEELSYDFKPIQPGTKLSSERIDLLAIQK
ncbi:FkbM family methyltransferase [Limnoraphis robusta Tam1]|uniref:FkbM family methyltransferase n=1 Tax=Limnoraphis robusta CCNP1315 TaxID=3110306 RepID=A0ABU5U730_9CYAN|nr:FkbM family methyltransferase [Limnoraphis robusta]MEA5499269.1 FkbM family methyltransferase [Limnoraphis robusta BA-68 BA1]MEA5521923.1 FkbM family methyltransferase [Limnoraphis robusta CCNP1315]MEA5539151.1 FkbM family methyltransferase [Limnoraphis robusta Tam1]MEA5545301.1 FkbM family methyltransferase [Limnoraphis robusta CCNP1324]